MNMSPYFRITLYMTQSWEYQEFNELKIKEHKITNYIIKNIKRTLYT